MDNDGPRFWFIAHVHKPLGLSNNEGWVCPSNDHVTVYTDEEKARITLPSMGRWVEWDS